jgi:hypothetical protein
MAFSMAQAQTKFAGKKFAQHIWHFPFKAIYIQKRLNIKISIFDDYDINIFVCTIKNIIKIS